MGLIDDDLIRLVFDLEFPVDRLEYSEGAEWLKLPPRLLQDISAGPSKLINIQTGWQTSQPRWLDRLHDVHLTWSNFFIKNNRCISIYPDAHTAVSGIVKWKDLSKTAGISCDTENFFISQSRLQNAEHIGGRTMFASSNEPHNWGMWLLYVVPAVMHFIKNRHVYDRLLVYATHANMKAMLHLLGVEDADMIIHDCSKAYHFDSIDVFRQPQRDFYVAPETRMMFADLRDKMLTSVVEPGPCNIYVNRDSRNTDPNSTRRLKNGHDLDQRLNMIGFKSIDPESLLPAKQIEVFGSAQKIVVLGGAGLFNAVFCRPGTRIIDIESTCYHIENHSTILSSMDADYGILLGQEDQNDPERWDKQWTVDVDRTIAAIAKFMF